MRIGIECLRADPGYVGGLNTYILGLLDALAAVGGGHSFQLYVTDCNRRLFARYESAENFELVVLDGRSFRLRQRICRSALLAPGEESYRRMSGRLLEPLREIMDAGSDLIYTPTVSLLCFDHRKPTLLSMHDIQHLHYPDFFSWPQRRSRKATCSLSAACASHFQASSEFIRRDMLAHFPAILPEQITVIPEGVNLEGFSTPRRVAALERYKLAPRFLLFPAQLWPHKNHLTVLEALSSLEQCHGVRIPLVMTGARYSAAPAIFRFLRAHRMDYVRYLGTVPFEDLVALYQRAALVLVPSLYESNSLPILEAAAAGTAVIASKIPPNQELVDSLRLNLFEALDPRELAELIFELWQNEGVCREQAAHNRGQVARFTWDNAARQYLSLMEKMGNAVLPTDQLQTAAVLVQ
ncbi:MAG: glycosyltransferase family 1 protein [Candidatus Sulfotelmatobacter sp.]